MTLANQKKAKKVTLVSKILYAASNMEHINNFHLPYISALREDGHEVKVMAHGEGADYDIPFEKKHLSWQNLKNRKLIKNIILKERFDIIIVNTTLAAFHIRRAIPRKRRPRLMNIVHGYLFADNDTSSQKRVLLFCEKIHKKKTDEIVVMNKEDLKIATENSLTIGCVKEILGMGATVRDSVFSVDEIREQMKSKNKFVMTFVGELSARKNQKLLIAAMPEIKMQIPNAMLWLIGDGSIKDELLAECEELGVSDCVVFTGTRTNPFDYIRASDLYVSASKIEGLPFNIMEAFGCGKITLASDIKGHRDIIEDGKSGFLYPSGDINEFIRLVLAVHNGELTIDPECAKARYKEFSFDNVFPKTYGVIKEFVEK